jgi:putative flippase GtrA
VKAFWDKIKSLIAEIIRFSLVGGLCFIIDYGLMVALKELLGVHYLLAAAVSFTVSVVVNYILCVVWAFKGVEKTNKVVMAAFFMTSLVGLGLTELFMWIFVDFMHISYLIAKIVTAVLVMIWNYITKKKALYMKRKEANSS